MTGTIKVMFDYGAYPIWYRYNDEQIFKNGIPVELSDAMEIEILFDEIEKRYEALFINNEVEFSYSGFQLEDEKNDFLKLLEKGMQLLESKCKTHFTLIDNSHIEEL